MVVFELILVVLLVPIILDPATSKKRKYTNGQRING